MHESLGFNGPRTDRGSQYMMHASQLLVMGAVNLVGPWAWLGCQQHTHYGPSLDSGVAVLCCLSGTFGTMRGWLCCFVDLWVHYAAVCTGCDV